MTVRAVAFDMDGVITQSMESHYEAYRQVFASRGVAIEPREVFAREGQSAPQVVRFINDARKSGISEEDLDAMARRKQQIFYGFGPMPLYDGARELVTDLAEVGMPLALVTGTWRANAEQHLGGLIERFDVVVAADDVRRTKPDPEPYLTAFSHLNVRPAESVVVENAVLGLEAAKAAGARVVGVASTLPADMLAGANVVVPDLAGVRAWLRAEGVSI